MITAREKAKERLKRPNIRRNEVLELNIVIANSFIESREYQEAIPYLYTAITNCEEEHREKRIRSLIDIFENNYDQAISNINKAIEIEGKTNKNIEILINILIGQKKFDTAINIIEDQPDSNYEELKANIWLSSKKYEKVIEIANNKAEEQPENIDWLLIKAESSILKLENDIINNKITYPHKIFEDIMPMLEKIEQRVDENIGIINRIKELKAVLYYRCNKYSEAKLLFEDLFHIEKDYSNHFFKNLLLNSLCDEDWQKTIKLIEEKNIVHDLEKSEILILADVYIRVGRANDAINLLKIMSMNLKVKTRHYLINITFPILIRYFHY
ncbi:hypothetical protein CV093_04480 [Oceanobacillus sp. 143]|nr:hypothetical protein CV093_04480 [Oceanobacillus sp. 143]